MVVVHSLLDSRFMSCDSVILNHPSGTVSASIRRDLLGGWGIGRSRVGWRVNWGSASWGSGRVAGRGRSRGVGRGWLGNSGGSSVGLGFGASSGARLILLAFEDGLEFIHRVEC